MRPTPMTRYNTIQGFCRGSSFEVMASITSRNPNERSMPSVDNGPRAQTTPTQFVRAKQRIHESIYELKPTLLQLISWILTLQVFLVSATWFITTLPIRVTADIYEHRIRAFFPELPSVRKLLVWLRSAVLSVLPDPGPEPAGPGATSSGSGSNPLPTLNVDLDAIRAGGTKS